MHLIAINGASLRVDYSLLLRTQGVKTARLTGVFASLPRNDLFLPTSGQTKKQIT
jgi:hypothetical protein